MSTRLDDRVVVWRLAVLTDDLTRGEVGALTREAEHLEREWNKRTVTNMERLRVVGTIDLFGEWGRLPRPKHAALRARREKVAVGERSTESAKG